MDFSLKNKETETMKIGVITDCFQTNHFDGIETAAGLGLNGVQIYATTGEFSPETLTDERKKRIKDILAEELENIRQKILELSNSVSQNPDIPKITESFHETSERLYRIINPNVKNKQRDAAIELYRCLLAFGIVLIHSNQKPYPSARNYRSRQS
jgi:hypothetical protein